jgi:hypothetical protein
MEPGNLELIHYAKRCKQMRSQDHAARGHDASAPPDEVSVFATLRQSKNEFK